MSFFELVQRSGPEASIFLAYKILYMKHTFKTILTLGLIVISLITMNAQKQKMENTALLLIDVQNDYFPGGKMTLEKVEQAAKNARSVLEYFRKIIFLSFISNIFLPMMAQRFSFRLQMALKSIIWFQIEEFNH